MSSIKILLQVGASVYIISIISLFGIQKTFSYTQTYTAQEISSDLIILIKQYPELYTPDYIVGSLRHLSLLSPKFSRVVFFGIEQNIKKFNICRTYDGERVSIHNECEYVDQDTCEHILGGIYNECASACRHMQVSICTLECIPVCIGKI